MKENPTEFFSSSAYGCSVEIAGIRFEIETESINFSNALRAHFAYWMGGDKHVESSKAEGDAAARLIWNDEGLNWSWSDGREGFLRVPDETVWLGATQIFINRTVAALAPSYLSLHANALIQEDGERMIALFGESGVGKTTLTHRWLEAHAPTWRLFAEDTLIIDPLELLAFPFPRAAGLRDWELDKYLHSPEKTKVLDHIEEPILRRSGFGSGLPEKAIAPYPTEWLFEGEGAIKSGQKITEGDVIILSRGNYGEEEYEPVPVRQSEDSAAQPCWEAFFSWTDAARLSECLKEQDVEAVDISEVGGVWLATVRSELPPAELERLLEEIADNFSALLLLLRPQLNDKSLGNAGTESVPPTRPPAPVIEAVETGVALQLMMKAVRRPSSIVAPAPGGADLFFSLAKWGANFRYWRLTPGGSPEGTNSLIRSTLS